MIFRWNGRPLTAKPGDTVAIALWRNGIRAVGASRKRHVPMGAGGMAVQGALVTINGLPHVHADRVLVTDGMDVRSQGAWPSRRFNLLHLLQFLPATLTRSGFERPYWLRSGTRRFELWERLLIHLAGGVDPPSQPQTALPGRRLDIDVVVVGGGPAGIQAANEAAAAGSSVCLISRGPTCATSLETLDLQTPALDPRVQPFFGHNVVGTYRRGTVVVAAPHDGRQPALVLVTRNLVLATGRESLMPLVPGRHLPGIFSARTALRWAQSLGAALGPTVVIGTGDQERVAASLRTVGVPIAAVADAGELTAVKGRRNVEKVQLAGRTVSAKSLVHAGPWIVDRSLAFQAGAGGRERLQSTTLPSNVRVVGTATHDDDPLSLSAAEPWDNVLVCPCMDVSAQDLVNRIDAGETHIEELKRSTSCGMGPCQGVGCWQAMQAVLAVRSGQPVNDAPSCRPPARGLTVAQAAGLDGLLELE